MQPQARNQRSPERRNGRDERWCHYESAMRFDHELTRWTVLVWVLSERGERSRHSEESSTTG
jgi:hypothetical protein